MHYSLNKKSFTMIEIVIVLVILTVIAGLTIPRFDAAIERSRVQEGVHVLRVLWAAQRQYFMDNGLYQNGNHALNNDWMIDGDLDVDIPPLKYFFTPYLHNDTTQVAQIGRNPLATSPYTLTIDENGNITCNNQFGYTYCSKIGF